MRYSALAEEATVALGYLDRAWRPLLHRRRVWQGTHRYTEHTFRVICGRRRRAGPYRRPRAPR